MTKLILSGGGDARDSIEHHRLFATWLSPGNRILYVPGGAFPAQESVDWITATFGELGNFSFLMCDVLSGDNMPPRGEFDGIYIGGGNTFTLLSSFREQGFDEELRGLAIDGCPVFGGSAGAILLGRDLNTCAHMDPNDVNLQDTRGLNLVNDYGIWCHYEASQMAMVRNYVHVTGIPVVALAENSALACVNETLRSVGPGKAIVFSLDQTQTEMESI